MIIDRLENWSFYRGLAPRIVRALEFLRESDVANIALGRHDLDGDHLFALVQEYTTKSVDNCFWEAHQRYCDVQYVVRGREKMGVAPISRMAVTQPYDKEKDVALFSGQGDIISFDEGMFAIYAPQDVHMPCMASETPMTIRKIVLKAEL